MISALGQAKAHATPDSTAVCFFSLCAVCLWNICTGRIFGDRLGLECQHKSCVSVTPSHGHVTADGTKMTLFLPIKLGCCYSIFLNKVL